MTKQKLLKEIDTITKNLKLFDLHIKYACNEAGKECFYLTKKQYEIARKTFDLL